MSEIRDLLQEFTAKLTTLIDVHTRARVEETVMTAMGAPPAHRRGRPPKQASAHPISLTLAPKTRKKMPVQLCPVPGCKNAAAPIFGMVCSEHRDVPKRLIKRYREARKAKKLAAAGKPSKGKRKVVHAKRMSTRRKVQPKPPTKKRTTPGARSAVPSLGASQQGQTAPSM